MESKKIQSTTHAMRANKAMDVEATGLRYYKKCGLVKDQGSVHSCNVLATAFTKHMELEPD